MTFDVKMWLNIIIAILFFGFLVLSLLSVRALVKQRDILIPSLMSRQSGLIEVLDVNIALLVIVVLVVNRLYIYIPVVAVFAFFILTTTRLKSGICNTGFFVGMTYIPWEQVKAYKLINDDINTLQLRFRANKRQYVMRCDKTCRGDITAILRKHSIKEQETINNSQEVTYETFN